MQNRAAMIRIRPDEGDELKSVFDGTLIETEAASSCRSILVKINDKAMGAAMAKSETS